MDQRSYSTEIPTLWPLPSSPLSKKKGKGSKLSQKPCEVLQEGISLFEQGRFPQSLEKISLSIFLFSSLLKRLGEKEEKEEKEKGKEKGKEKEKEKEKEEKEESLEGVLSLRICVLYKLAVGLLIEAKIYEGVKESDFLCYLYCVLGMIPLFREHRSVCLRLAIRANLR